MLAFGRSVGRSIRGRELNRTICGMLRVISFRLLGIWPTNNQQESPSSLHEPEFWILPPFLYLHTLATSSIYCGYLLCAYYVCNIVEAHSRNFTLFLLQLQQGDYSRLWWFLLQFNHVPDISPDIKCVIPFHSCTAFVVVSDDGWLYKRCGNQQPMVMVAVWWWVPIIIRHPQKGRRSPSTRPCIFQLIFEIPFLIFPYHAVNLPGSVGLCANNSLLPISHHHVPRFLPPRLVVLLLPAYDPSHPFGSLWTVFSCATSFALARVPWFTS